MSVMLFLCSKFYACRLLYSAVTKELAKKKAKFVFSDPELNSA